ncbi:MAG: tetratricopeptide repeat protein [Cyclobacteriaceae bacterium]
MKKLIYLIAGLSFSVYTYGSSPSNRETLIARADSLYAQADIYFDQQDSASLFRDLSAALSVYQSLQDTNSIANVTNDFGYYYYFYGDFEKSISYYRKALVLDEAQRDTIAIIGRHYNIGSAFNKLGQFVPALEHLMQGWELAKKINRAKSMAMVSNSLANLFRQYEQYDDAAYYFHLSLHYSRQEEDSMRVAFVLNNLGQLHKYQQNYDSALYYYLKALHFKQALGNDRSMASTQANLGELYLLQDSLKKAGAYLQTARDTFQKNLDTYNLAWVSNILTKLYLKQQAILPARAMLDSVQLYLQQELDARQERMIYFENEYQWHQVQGQLAKALEYYRRWAEMRDSLFNEEHLKVQQIQASYQLRQEEQARQLAENQTLIANVETQRQRSIALGIALLLGISIGVGLILYKKNQEISSLNSQNELLVREQHHRVNNHLQALSGMLGMQSRRLNEQNAREIITESELRLQAIGLIHRHLYASSIPHIHMKVYLEELVGEILRCYGISARLDLQIEDIVLDERQAIPIGLIVNELVTNACKYAFADHTDPLLSLRLTSDDQQLGHLIVKDNGSGLDPKKLEEKGTFGIQLIQMQAKQLQAYAAFKQEQGLRYTLTFKIHKLYE